MAKPAFRLRRATAEDYSIFRQFYLAFDCDWLMNDNENPILSNNEFDEDLDSNAYYFNIVGKSLLSLFNEEMYQNYLKWYKIFLVESTKTQSPVGFVQMEVFAGKQIIRKWHMLPEHQDDALLGAILSKCEAKHYQKCEGLQVIAMSNQATTFLEANGYHAKQKPFFEKSVSE